jgi:plastocyanin
MKTIRICGYVLILFFFLISCSEESSNKKYAKHTIEIKEMKFQPAELIVQVGDTVVWINRDLVVHDVTEYPGKSWSSAAIQNGGTWSYVVKSSIDYFCNIHQVMKGRLIVK